MNVAFLRAKVLIFWSDSGFWWRDFHVLLIRPICKPWLSPYHRFPQFNPNFKKMDGKASVSNGEIHRPNWGKLALGGWSSVHFHLDPCTNDVRIPRRASDDHNYHNPCELATSPRKLAIIFSRWISEYSESAIIEFSCNHHHSSPSQSQSQWIVLRQGKSKPESPMNLMVKSMANPLSIFPSNDYHQTSIISHSFHHHISDNFTMVSAYSQLISLISAWFQPGHFRRFPES